MFHLRGMCKRPNCDLKHISKSQAIEMGLPPTTCDAVMHPIIIPEEPEIRKEAGNQIYMEEDDDNLFTAIESVMTPQKTQTMYHALIAY